MDLNLLSNIYSGGGNPGKSEDVKNIPTTNDNIKSVDNSVSNTNNFILFTIITILIVILTGIIMFFILKKNKISSESLIKDIDYEIS